MERSSRHGPREEDAPVIGLDGQSHAICQRYYARIRDLGVGPAVVCVARMRVETSALNAQAAQNSLCRVASGSACRHDDSAQVSSTPSCVQLDQKSHDVVSARSQSLSKIARQLACARSSSTTNEMVSCCTVEKYTRCKIPCAGRADVVSNGSSLSLHSRSSSAPSDSPALSAATYSTLDARADGPGSHTSFG